MKTYHNISCVGSDPVGTLAHYDLALAVDFGEDYDNLERHHFFSVDELIRWVRTRAPVNYWVMEVFLVGSKEEHPSMGHDPQVIAIYRDFDADEAKGDYFHLCNEAWFGPGKFGTTPTRPIFRQSHMRSGYSEEPEDARLHALAHYVQAYLDQRELAWDDWVYLMNGRLAEMQSLQFEDAINRWLISHTDQKGTLSESPPASALGTYNSGGQVIFTPGRAAFEIMLNNPSTLTILANDMRIETSGESVTTIRRRVLQQHTKDPEGTESTAVVSAHAACNLLGWTLPEFAYLCGNQGGEKPRLEEAI